MILPGVAVALLDPGLNGTPGMTNVDLTTFAEVAVDASCSQIKVILDGPKKTGDRPRREAYSFYVVLVTC
jgi:hypothetical protein